VKKNSQLYAFQQEKRLETQFATSYFQLVCLKISHILQCSNAVGEFVYKVINFVSHDFVSNLTAKGKLVSYNDSKSLLDL